MRRFADHVAIVCLALVAAAAPGCSTANTPAQPAHAEARLVTIGGAVTEIAFALGAGPTIVGVDTSSTFPQEALALPKVGYQRTLGAEGVLSLAPTLVVASADAGPPDAIDQIRAAGVEVVIIPAGHSFDGVREKVGAVAKALGRDADAARLVAALDADATRANESIADVTDRPKVLFLLSRGAGSIVASGQNTAADSMIALAGGVNAITGYDGYKPLTPEAAIKAAPDIILVTTTGLESLGGIDGLLKLPGMALTPAGRASRVVALEDLYLLGFGPRTGAAVVDLAARLHGPSRNAV